MLSIVELGIGTTIIYHLYKPIAEQNIETIKSLMNFYKKTYYVITLCIATIGICIIPFLGGIVGNVSIKENIIFIYILFLIDVICSYLLSYKRSIFYATQKNYMIDIIHIIYLLLLNITQILILIFTKNYIAYLVMKIVFRILENIIITWIANRKYPYLKEKQIQKVDTRTLEDIKIKIKSLLFHQIGGYIVTGTDNIIISKFLGVSSVGLYSNYYLITNSLEKLIGQMFSAITGSVGNLLVTQNEKKSFDIYKKLHFFNFWTYSFAAICFFNIVQSFIKIFFGEAYVLPYSVVIVIAINFYIQGMRATIKTFKSAAGIYYEDRFIPLLEALINIIASIMLVKLIGFPGVFLGTIISTSILYLFSYPKYVYKKLFKRSYGEYILEILKYFIITIVVGFMTYTIGQLVRLSNVFLELIIRAIIAIFFSNTVYYLLFRKTQEFQYYQSLIKQMLYHMKYRRNEYGKGRK